MTESLPEYPLQPYRVPLGVHVPPLENQWSRLCYLVLTRKSLQKGQLGRWWRQYPPEETWERTKSELQVERGGEGTRWEEWVGREIVNSWCTVTETRSAKCIKHGITKGSICRLPWIGRAHATYNYHKNKQHSDAFGIFSFSQAIW